MKSKEKIRSRILKFKNSKLKIEYFKLKTKIKNL